MELQKEKKEDQAKWEKMKTANVVSIAIALFCFSFLIILMFFEIPDKNRDIVNFLSGLVFGTGFQGVVYFLFNFKKKANEIEQVNDYSEHNVQCINCPKDKIH